MAEATTPAAERGSGRKAMGEITSRRVLAIALPIVLSNATIPLLGMVDTGVVGQLGRAEPIGAVAIGAVILTSLYWVFSFLRMGTSGLVAQAHGAGDARASGAHLLRALAIAGAVTALASTSPAAHAEPAVTGDDQPQSRILGGSGAGHLTLSNSGTDTILRGNTDADSAFEFQLVIHDGSGVSASHYTAADFLL